MMRHVAHHAEHQGRRAVDEIGRRAGSTVSELTHQEGRRTWSASAGARPVRVRFAGRVVQELAIPDPDFAVSGLGHRGSVNRSTESPQSSIQTDFP
jgi:hypothetical protein